MIVLVNGAERELADGSTVADLLVALGVPGAGIAVAMDGAVVPRAAHPSTPVPDGAVLEVLTAVQGG
ncbi:sulfur carrier protein ThiS [Actinokineospora globicatena]|uniref:Thiamine biosynthesis protein ThiS n=1 Tax=Actinokineospora globicatena TaxID=103729 RepID=A0A9W6QNJ6_9PSEU|nr:sulfur carrier protein ThiS [Actinokineospora globicatena]MCP2300839.1 sulfur carrier protein [Actinokineospora globicatena]GLW77535.1 thiamine biosynthesis protein ThiS [Actinokineospora globicatena]GLW84369.1 thiamine biosynthesis protein ThiS [Actinokineospora globicatena]GLW93045.1 thiamine biosynthesis protein ThiS [Actinokineospora globicatena]